MLNLGLKTSVISDNTMSSITMLCLIIKLHKHSTIYFCILLGKFIFFSCVWMYISLFVALCIVCMSFIVLFGLLTTRLNKYYYCCCCCCCCYYYYYYYYYYYHWLFIIYYFIYVIIENKACRFVSIHMQLNWRLVSLSVSQFLVWHTLFR